LYEPAVLRLDANTLIIVTRAATQANPSGHEPMMLSRSTDNGATWSDWKKFSQIGDSPTLFKHSSGKVFLADRRRGTPFSTSIMWSGDGGLTWGSASTVYAHSVNDCAYPSIIELSDGSLLVSHYEPQYVRVTPVAIT
jgi:hypothetical protein